MTSTPQPRTPTRGPNQNHSGTRRRRAQGRVALEEHEQLCPQCGHQIGAHCAGGPPREGDWGALYDPLWVNASGTCGHPVPDPDDPTTTATRPCGCTARTRLQGVAR